MEYDPAGNNLEAWLRESTELRDYVQEVCEIGADRWAALSKWRTGFNATHVRAYTHRGEGGQIEGIIDAWGHYARFREHGTRYNKAESILADFKEAIEETGR